MPGDKAAPPVVILMTVLPDSVIPPPGILNDGVAGAVPSKASETVLDPQLTVPLMVAPAALTFKVWLALNVNPEDRPETSNVAPPATLMLGLLAIEPLPLRASVPALMVVFPL